MTLSSLLLILTSVFISAGAQILLKIGMNRIRAEAVPDAAGGLVAAFLPILTSPYVMGGLCAYGIGALVWLKVLAQVDVSQAYPFVALGFIVTMAAGFFLLHEPLHTTRVIGGVLILAGVVLVGLR